MADDRTVGGGRNPLLDSVERSRSAQADAAGGVAQVRHGLEAIDDQHLAILALVHDLVQAGRAGRPGAELEQRLADVRDAVRSHFVSEETLMRVVLFPGLPAHRQIHARLLELLDALAVASGGLAKDDLDALERIGTWFLDHFRDADSSYVEYLRERNQTHLVSPGLFEKF